jgi:hypothetical protein
MIHSGSSGLQVLDAEPGSGFVVLVLAGPAAAVGDRAVVDESG